MMDTEQKSPRDRERERDRSRRSDRGPRPDSGNGNSGGNGENRDRSRERREGCRIYVSNVPYEYRWQDLKDLFRREVGDVSFVELFLDENHKPRGCGIVEFKNADSVGKSLEKMNRYEINGRHLVIKEDYGNERDEFGRIIRNNNAGGGGGGGGGGQGQGGGGGGGGNFRRDNRDDDRPQYADLKQGVINRPLLFSTSSSNPSRSGRGGMNNDYEVPYNTYGLSTSFLEGLGIQGPLHTKVFVANLDYKVDTKKLKQVFKLAGKVINVDLSLDKEGNSRGFAVIEYDHPVEAVQAISMLDRQMLFDRRMTVRLDRVPDKNEGVKLPEGLKGLGIGLGPNGEPLRDVARNLPNIQQNLNMNQNSGAPVPVAPPPLNGPTSLLGPVPNSSLSSNLAALSNAVSLSGLSGVGGLSNPLLSSAAQSLSSLGLGLGNSGGGNSGNNNDMGNSGNSGGNNYQPSSVSNAYSSLGGGYSNSSYNQGGNRSDFDMGPASNSVRSYNTQPQDDFSRPPNNNYSSGGQGSLITPSGGRKTSDTIVIKNLPPSCTWQTLRDKFRDIGEVKFAEIRGQDTGVVRFSKERDAELAIKLMDGSRLEGRAVDVTFF